MTQNEAKSIFNTDKASEATIEWVLKRTQDLFKDNKKLIVSNPLLCPVRKLLALTLNPPVLPSYIELADSLTFMSIVFDVDNKTIAKKECERLLAYLVLHLKEGVKNESTRS